MRTLMFTIFDALRAAFRQLLDPEGPNVLFVMPSAFDNHPDHTLHPEPDGTFVFQWSTTPPQGQGALYGPDPASGKALDGPVPDYPVLIIGHDDWTELESGAEGALRVWYEPDTRRASATMEEDSVQPKRAYLLNGKLCCELRASDSRIRIGSQRRSPGVFALAYRFEGAWSDEEEQIGEAKKRLVVWDVSSDEPEWLEIFGAAPVKLVMPAWIVSRDFIDRTWHIGTWVPPVRERRTRRDGSTQRAWAAYERHQ